jgi:hypothetical protein
MRSSSGTKMMQLKVNGAEHKRSDAELAQLISNGQAGMLAFKGALSADQIHLGDAHSFAASKEVLRTRSAPLPAGGNCGPMLFNIESRL